MYAVFYTVLQRHREESTQDVELNEFKKNSFQNGQQIVTERL